MPNIKSAKKRVNVISKKTEINKIFTNYDYMPFGRKCQGNGTKQRKKKDKDGEERREEDQN